MRKMTTGQKAVTFLGAAAPSFADTFFRARGMMNQEQNAAANQKIAQGRLQLGQGNLANDLLNTGLRGGELEEKIAARGSVEQRAGARNKIDLFKTMGGQYAQHNPEGYGAALQADNPSDFARLMGAAQGLALQNQTQQAGRLSGTRAAAGASAKSNQKQIDNQRIAETQAHIKAGTLDQAVAQGFKPFHPPPRSAGQSMDDALDKANIQLGGQDIAHARRLAASGQIIPHPLAVRSAQAAIKRNRALDAEYEGADPERRAAIEGQIIDELFGIENVE